MLNTRALTRPSPNDANLRTSGDPLGMLRLGKYDQNRNPFYVAKRHLSNNTNDNFNHLRMIGGYNNDGQRIRDKINAANKGGILPLDTPNGTQPFRNALTAPMLVPKVSKLIDFKPVPMNELITPPPVLPLRA